MTKLETVRKTLRKYLPSEIRTNDFIMTEMVLAVLEYTSPSCDAGSAYILLHNYNLIGKIHDLKETSFLQKAQLCLRKCSSKQNLQLLLEQYQKPAFKAVRFYNLILKTENGKQILKLKRNSEVKIAPDRTNIYIEYIYHFQENRSTNYAKAGTYRYWTDTNDYQMKEVKIPDRKIVMPDIPAPKNEREEITVEISDLLSSAEEMRKIIPDDYCANILKTNMIKTVSGKYVIPAEKISVSGAVSLVGMVGSGKSTLMKVLSYHLAKQKKKIILVLDTVADTFHMYEYLLRLKLNVSSLIGKSERRKYIYQLIEPNSSYLKSEYSEYLTAPCIISGMTNNSETAQYFGKEPCTRLKKGNKNYTCPYIDICPAMKMYRDIFTSDIIVITVQGACVRPYSCK